MTVLLEVVAPVFGVMVLGALSVKIRALNEEAVKGLVLFVFNFAIPILLFRSLAHAELPPDIRWAFLLSYYGGAFTVFAAGMALARFVFKRSLEDQAIFGMSAGFSNTVLIGIPILFTAYGPEATVPTLLILAFHGPVLMSLTTGL
ncbi:MAG: AEC family transporter, partial [Gemmatimonadota bacterium]